MFVIKSMIENNLVFVGVEIEEPSYTSMGETTNYLRI